MNTKYIIITSGFDCGYGINQTEALLLKNCLVNYNIEESKIILDESAEITQENITNLFLLLVNNYTINKILNNVDNIDLYLVTSEFHIKRSKIILNDVYNALKYNVYLNKIFNPVIK